MTEYLVFFFFIPYNNIVNDYIYDGGDMVRIYTPAFTPKKKKMEEKKIKLHVSTPQTTRLHGYFSVINSQRVRESAVPSTHKKIM